MSTNQIVTSGTTVDILNSTTLVTMTNPLSYKMVDLVVLLTY
jgi:hypothetical protein